MRRNFIILKANGRELLLQEINSDNTFILTKLEGSNSSRVTLCDKDLTIWEFEETLNNNIQFEEGTELHLLKLIKKNNS